MSGFALRRRDNPQHFFRWGGDDADLAAADKYADRRWLVITQRVAHRAHLYDIVEIVQIGDAWQVKKK